MYLTTFYLVRIRALISLYKVYTDKYTRIFLRYHFIKSMRHSNMFQPLKVHLQGVIWYTLPASSTKWVNRCKIHLSMQRENIWWFILSNLLLKCIKYSPWRWPFKDRNMLERHIVLIKWRLSNIWAYLSVIIWYYMFRPLMVMIR